METQKGSHEKQLAELEDELKSKLNVPTGVAWMALEFQFCANGVPTVT